MQEFPDRHNIKDRIERAYAMAAPYLSDHPSVLEFIQAHKDLEAEDLCALIEERLSGEVPPRSTDLRILKNAVEKEI
ncbi:MAG: hypothetical protein QGH39_00830 [Candidatus Thermoplasmatota archaeon]|nr:hypothetical protein [Candidatus Thermoplasmatota archaeon]